LELGKEEEKLKPLLLQGVDSVQRSKILYPYKCKCFWSLSALLSFLKKEKKKGLVELEGKLIKGLAMIQVLNHLPYVGPIGFLLSSLQSHWF